MTYDPDVFPQQDFQAILIISRFISKWKYIFYILKKKTTKQLQQTNTPDLNQVSVYFKIILRKASEAMPHYIKKGDFLDRLAALFIVVLHTANHG